MRLVPFALLAMVAVILAACDSGPEVDLTNATPTEVAEAMKKNGATRIMVRPGKWTSTVAVLEMNSPGMPPEMQAQMKARLGQPRTVEACLTAEQVDNPERMLGNVPSTCRYDRYTMGGGKINGTMRCEQQGMIQEMTVAGTYSTDLQLVSDKDPLGAKSVAVQPAGSMFEKREIEIRGALAMRCHACRLTDHVGDME